MPFIYWDILFLRLVYCIVSKYMLNDTAAEPEIPLISYISWPVISFISGSRPGRDDIVDFSDVGLSNIAVTNITGISDGTTLYFTVKGWTYYCKCAPIKSFIN